MNPSLHFQNDLETIFSAFESCPHPLKGKFLRVGSLATNPFNFIDTERNLLYNENGNPLGTNARYIS